MPIYQPAEDSFLMSEILKKEIPNLLITNPELKILEIGAGSGIHLETLSKLGVKKQNIFSVDIDNKSVAHCRNLRFPSEAQKEIAQPQRKGRLSEGNHGCPRGFHCIQSDLFENVEDKFKVIIFNPPYLPEDAREPCDSQTATTGGKSGCEIINRFLKDAKDYLLPDGKIFLITSSLTKDINWLDWKKKQIGCERLFFEELCVWELN